MQPDLAENPEHYNDSRADKHSYRETEGSELQGQSTRETAETEKEDN